MSSYETLNNNDGDELTFEQFLSNQMDLDRFFYTRARDVNTQIVKAISINPWWTIDNFSTFAGRFKVESDLYNYISSYSKKSFSYPTQTVQMKMPDFSGADEGFLRTFRWGFEDGSNAGNMQIMWNYQRTVGNVDVLYATVNSPWSKTTINSDNIAVNANYKTVAHNYQVKVGKSIVYWYIDDVLVNVTQFATGRSYNIGTTTKPLQQYSQGCIPMPLPTKLRSLWELTPPSAPSADYIVTCSPYFFRVTGSVDGEMPFFQKLKILLSASTIAGTSIASGTQTSQTLFGMGYGKKTLYFIGGANGGNLVINYIDAGGTYRQYSLTVVPVTAGFVPPIQFPDDCAAIQVAYTPTAYPEVPAMCEVYYS